MGCLKARRLEPTFQLVGLVVAFKRDAPPRRTAVRNIVMAAVPMLLNFATNLFERVMVLLRRLGIVEMRCFPFDPTEADDFTFRRFREARCHRDCNSYTDSGYGDVYGFLHHFVTPLEW